MLELDKLWRGEIAPYDKHIKKDSEYGKLLHGLCEREDQLQKELTEKGKSLYTDIQDVQSAMNAKENQAAFEKGVPSGNRLASGCPLRTQQRFFLRWGTVAHNF